MDGLPPLFTDSLASGFQKTLKSEIGCVGTALHSGARVALTLRPAPAGTGIVFHRSDLGIDVPASFSAVSDTRLCTVLTAPDAPHARVGTVEHVMAALAGCGIDNAIVELDGAEVPVLDGSAAPFVFLIDCAGVIEQSAPSRAIEIRRGVCVTDGDAFVELLPTVGRGLDLAVSIAFDAAAIGRQSLTLRAGEAGFRTQLSSARTFAMAADIAGLQALGLARGGSLDNAVVVDGARVLNPAGLRMPDEFVRHKTLDIIGDLALAGAPIHGRLTAHRPGHALNNRVLRALFADASNWAWAGLVPDEASAMGGWGSVPMAAAAAPF